VHVFWIVLEKQTGDFRNCSVFSRKESFSKCFFENFSKNMKLVIKLLSLSKRQPKYQRVETNMFFFDQLSWLRKHGVLQKLLKQDLEEKKHPVFVKVG
jgi:hypothetical protein